MFHMLVLFCLCWWRLIGVFGDSVSVMEGDSVTLYTDLTEISEEEDILWKYGAENSLIAKMKQKKQTFITSDGPDGRFRDRLKLDDQTGSLTITNIRPEHAGLYQLEIKGVKLTTKTFSVCVNEAHCCDSVEAVLRLVVTALMGVAAGAAAVLLVNDVRSTRG